jgi:hypothetical protein
VACHHGARRILETTDTLVDLFIYQHACGIQLKHLAGSSNVNLYIVTCNLCFQG